MDSLLTSLTRQALLLRLQVSEKRSVHTTRDDRRPERSQFRTEVVAVDQLVLRCEQEKHGRRVTLERKPSPLPQAVDGQVEITGSAPSVVPALTFRGRTVDELLEWSPESHRVFEWFDADAHFVAILDPVVHIEAVHRGPNEASQYGATFSCFAVHCHFFGLLGREARPERLEASTEGQVLSGVGQAHAAERL
jgi:hypothetical protein